MRAIWGLFLLAPTLAGCSVLPGGSDPDLYVYGSRPIAPLVTPAVVGKPASHILEAVTLPIQREPGPADAETLAWVQADRSRVDGSTVACRESVTVQKGVVTDYRRSGC